MQLAFGETPYKVAVSELSGYYEGHNCGQEDCELSYEFYNREYNNDSPTKSDIDTIAWQITDMADMRQIGDNDLDEETGEPHYINVLISALENELLHPKN